MKGELAVFFTLIALLLLCLLGIGLSGKARADGCREAGGSMIGQICLIRNDCNALGKRDE